jgi:curved DNA-binding protein CbpA
MSPFDVLLIDSDADEAEITQAYRQRVTEAHPDQGGSISEFQRVQTAYAKLTAGYSVEDHESKSVDEIAHQRDESRIEYLNYEILDDHGWNVTDGDLFEKAAAEDLDPTDYGEFLAQPHESLLS